LNKEKYKNTVDLLIDILPFVLSDERFALKGGTAINLFHRDFLRLSVDIDVCYLPLEDRSETFKNIHGILAQIKLELESKLGLKVNVGQPLDGKKESKIFVQRNDILVKIEPNFILRSCLFPVQNIDLAKKASLEFQKSVQARCLSFADTFGGKICAALDRQHPRDLFDVKYLLKNEGITTEVKDSFIFYLISHNRPINELLSPNLKNIKREFKDEFIDMSQVEVELDELLETRDQLIKLIRNSLTENDKRFLISFVSNSPDWSLVRNAKIRDFPSVLWKIHNQEKITSSKLKEYVKAVEKILF
jgi:predicted nucleotidyltransferase component of viral defense system